VETGVAKLYPSFPRVWNNIYSSWNLAFCSNYKNWPSFFAKLLNPATCGTYQRDDAGLYLWPRTVTLYLHLHHMMLERAALKSRDPEGLDWRSESITEIFGRVNLIAARLYRDRVDQVIGELHGNRRNADKFACMACIEMHWIH